MAFYAEWIIVVGRPIKNLKEANMKQYKVLTQKDRFFSGKFDPEKLENAINSYATEGWTVISVATASIPSITGTREELIVVMERDK